MAALSLFASPFTSGYWSISLNHTQLPALIAAIRRIFFTHNGMSGGSTGCWQQHSVRPVKERGWEGRAESGSLSMKQHGATICEPCQIETLQHLKATATIPIRKQQTDAGVIMQNQCECCRLATFGKC